MTDDGNTVLLTILNKSYRVNCPPEERSALLESARYLDERMYRIQRRGPSLDREHIAVMVALNIANELLKKPSGDGGESPLDEARLVELENKLDRVLADEAPPQD
ncbi:MAG: cell division protein ZapA [Gammaproteobacteria bacterium]|nr:cell division protein ZapA [Gammaproteobacteria bacterium]MDE0479704.1 cell division protein ZapA [Gammaproteobacteria bacterium]MDE0509200.1 cell division protein ZapA [Gammaproteobacteria bacterium]MXY91353.1 cell division protein ZapA [Gammaproteobacteria bacterium]MXZ32239.1 cell division protein ZapA [Gammaproteobacteria bacterium]